MLQWSPEYAYISVTVLGLKAKSGGVESQLKGAVQGSDPDSR